jgi:hypothetical protein
MASEQGNQVVQYVEVFRMLVGFLLVRVAF